MRKLLIFGLLSLGIAVLTPAHQHASYARGVASSSMHSVAVATASPTHSFSAPSTSQVPPAVNSVAPEIRPVVNPKPPAHPVPPKPLPPSHGTNPPNSGNSAASTCNNNLATRSGSNSQQFSGTNPNPGGCYPVNGVVLPLFGGEAFYLPVAYIPDSTSDDQEQGNAQVNAQAYSQANDSNAQSDSDSQASDGESSRSADFHPDSDTPEEPLAEFVFVRRDGSTFNAVGYTFLNDNLRYITDDGLRRTVPLDSLDFDATQKSNEERGLTINLPTVVSPA